MDIAKLKRIFDFLEAKENKIPKYKRTLTWKIMLNYPLTEEDLNFKGNLDLYKSKIKSLPKGLKISGYLHLYKTKITSLPEGLEVGGSLDLRAQKKITSLPDDLKVGGELNIIGCDAITSLPKGLEVGKILYIKYTPLTKYSDEELREMIKPGFIKGEIVR
jgi:hypothetical protein